MARNDPAADPRPPHERRARALLLAATITLLATSAPAGAATVRLDTSLPDADLDAILDGFPGLAPNDGVGDLPGNALAVSLKTGVTEERAFVELPLAPLVAAGGSAATVVAATLTFNVDDVLTTFGPGTDFDGSAGERILISTYAGDGIVGFDDYTRGLLAATVQTGPQGSITDASLRSSGPVKFTVDLTERVKTLLAQNATHIGIAFATDDSPTGTSIDDLGDGGAGPPGAGGAAMPFLTVETVDATPTPVPTPTAAPTAAATSSPAATQSPSPGATAAPVATPSPGASATPLPTTISGAAATPTPPFATPTPVAATPRPTLEPTPSGSATTATPPPGTTATPASSATPVSSGTPAATATPTTSRTPAPTATVAPQLTPTPRPIATPSPRGTATPAPTGSETSPALTLEPDGSGDQLIFYYDARELFTTFLNLHNLGVVTLEVHVVLYDLQLAQPFTEVVALPAGATRTIDLGVLHDAGLPARAGAAFATAVDTAGTAKVTRALAGSFTIANLATGSAWGAPAAARRAVGLDEGGGSTPALGARIDGSTVRLRALHPDRLGLAVFYDPQTLEPAEEDGNQLIFLSFADADGVVPAASATTWSLDARRNDGRRLTADAVVAAGVVVTHIDELLGAAAEGAAGSISFTTEGGAPSRLIFFNESLGNFSTGYLLPPVAP